MSNGGPERAETPEEGKRKKKEKKEPSTEKERKEKLPVEKKEESIVKAVEKLLGGVAKEAKGVTEEFRGLRQETVNLRVAFELLEDRVKKGTIKLEEFEKVMDRITEGMSENFDQLEKRKEKLLKLLDAELEQRGDVIEKLHSHAEELGETIVASELASQKIRKLAEAAQETGILMAPVGERPPDWKKSTPEEREEWFDEKLKRLLLVKSPFAENWRMSWDLERFLASIPKEEREEYRRFAEKFDRMRVEHACFLGYDAATSVEALQNVGAALNLSKIEAGLKDKEVVDELVSFQEDAEKFVGAREKLEGFDETPEGKRLAELEKKKEEERSPDEKDEYGQLKKTKDKLEEERNNWVIRIKRKLEGYEVKLSRGRDKKPIIDREPKFDEEKGLAKIEAGRLFVFLGIAAGYDIAELTGGDFFLARDNHLLNRILGKAKQEGDRWWRRDRLVDWMKRKIGEDEKEMDEETGEPRKITGLEVFTHKFSGGLLASVLKPKQLEQLGLERYRKWKRDRLIDVVKIRDKDKLRKVDFEKMGITRENQLSGDVLDAARNADEVRATLFGHNGYLDLPTWTNYLKFAELFKHLRGSPDEIGFGGQKPRGGTEKDRLMVLMHKDWLHFFRGPGKGTRFLTELFTLGILPTLKPEYRFVRRLRAIDPETGKEKLLGFSLGDSDGELLKLGRSVDSVDVHGFVDEAVRKGCYSPQYAEGILRDEIKLLKVLPGIAPFRNVQEVLDTIGLGGFIGGIFVFIFAPILEFARRLAKQMERA